MEISSPRNDTITICGKRNGLSLTFNGYSDELTLTFKSVNRSTGPGFSCRLSIFAKENSNVINQPDEIIENDFEGTYVN